MKLVNIHKKILIMPQVDLIDVFFYASHSKEYHKTLEKFPSFFLALKFSTLDFSFFVFFFSIFFFCSYCHYNYLDL